METDDIQDRQLILSKELETEQREYILNKKTAMQKKLQATDKAEINIKETSGGTKLERNAGLYELMKVATDIFYSADRNKMKYRKTEAKDRQGYVIETRYKSSRGRNTLYTFHMYHITIPNVRVW